MGFYVLRIGRRLKHPNTEDKEELFQLFLCPENRTTPQTGDKSPLKKSYTGFYVLRIGRRLKQPLRLLSHVCLEGFYVLRIGRRLKRCLI